MGTDLSPFDNRWKTRVYAFGVIGGVVFGLVAALLYSRAAEEEAQQGDPPPPIPTGTLLGLVLSALALARQIAEAGKTDRKKSRK